MEIIKGEDVEKDISFYSNFMLGMMGKIGNSTQSTYRSIGVVSEDIIFIVMDNAGGHGTNKSMLYYSEYLTAKYNIVVHNQVPRSP